MLYELYRVYDLESTNPNANNNIQTLMLVLTLT